MTIYYVLTAAVIIELILTAFTVWGYVHEEKLIAFEDLVKKECRRIVYRTVRSAVIAVFLIYRHLEIKLLMKLLSDLGMKAVKVKKVSKEEWEKERSNEALPW